MSVELNKLCELIVDCPHSTAADEGSGYPLIRTPNIGAGYFDLEGVHRVCKATYDKRNQRAVPRASDLILAREAPAGNVAIIPEGAEFCLGQRTVLIRPDANQVYPPFLNYYLNAPEQQHKLLKNANGATVSHVNMPIIRHLPIEPPSMEEQKRIAGILSAYDSLIENNRKQIKLLEEAAQRLYKKWFINLHFPGHETASTNPKTGLPEKWKRIPLGSYQKFKRGNIVTEKNTNPGSIPVVAGGRRPAYYHDIANTKGPVITISGSGANAGFTRLYMQNIWASDCSYVDSSMCQTIFFVYETVLVLGNGFKHLQRGSAQPHVYPKDINKLPIILPEETVLNNFEKHASTLYREISLLEREINAAREARDRLLPKLIPDEVEA